MLRGDNHGHAFFDNAGFFRRDLIDATAEIFGVVERNRRNHSGKRALNYVGGVEPPAHADFEQQHIGGMAREQHKADGSGNFEHRDRRSGIGALTLFQRARQFGIRHQLAAIWTGQPEALVEAHQMRRGVNVHALAGGFQHRAQERDGGSLAIGTGDVDDRRQLPLWMSERIENAQHAIEREIDEFWMQRGQPRDDGIDGRHRNVTRAPGPAIWSAASAPWSAAGTIRRACRAICGGGPPYPPCRVFPDIRRAGTLPVISRGWSAR